jgi:acetylornithine deacetylase
MKGGLVSGILAIAAIRQAGVRLKGNVYFQSVIGEETGGVGTLAAVLRGYRADAAIVLEPTHMEICPVGAGALSFRLRVPGLAAHGALRQEGISSVEKFYALFDAIKNFEKQKHAGFHHPLFREGSLAAPISVGKLQAGDWISTVPDHLVAEGRYGVLPGENVSNARTAFEAAIRAAADSDSWLAAHPPEVEWIEGQFAPAETPANAPILAVLRDAHTHVCHAAPVFRGVPYGSDLRFFTNDAGMHAVLYGPGDVRLAHAVNEHVPLGEVVQVAKVIAVTLIEWCGT